MKPRMKPSQIAILACAIALIPTVAIAQTDFPSQVRGLLADEANSELPDYVLQGQPAVSSLNQGGRQSRAMRLNAGVDYAFMATCDSDCSDIDLYIFDRRGNVIDFDREDNKFPIVFFTPDVTANYRVEVEIYSCSSQPCYYAIGRFSR